MFELVVWIALISGLVAITMFALASMLIMRRRERIRVNRIQNDTRLTKLDEALNEALTEINKTSRLVLESIDEKYQAMLFLYDLLEEKRKEITALSGSAYAAAAQAQIQAQAPQRKMVAMPFTPLQQSAPAPVVSNASFASLVTIASDIPAAPSVLAMPSTSAALAAPVASVAPVSSVDSDTGSKRIHALLGNSRYEKIWELHKSGLPVPDIAKTLDIGQGEVKLILDLAGR